MESKTILILGGGVGGIATANALRNRLEFTHRVVIIEKQPEYVFTPSLLWVMVGWRKASQITRPLSRLVRPGVEVVQAEAQEIDPDGQMVKTSAGDFHYDFLVITLGANLAPEAMPGFLEGALTPYDLQGATGLWSALQGFMGGRVAILVASMPYKCPAAPYETALLLDDYLRQRGFRERSTVEVYTPETLPMGVAGPDMGRAVVGMLEAKGIAFHPDLQPVKVDPQDKKLLFANREAAPYDLLAGVPPHSPPAVVRDSSLSNAAGWIPVDKRTLQTSVENVYAIGDVASITLANGKALPKAAVFADGQGLVVARRIEAAIQGRQVQAEFDGLGFCWIETGGGSAGFASGEFYAEPDPRVPLPRSGRIWHWGKILFEKYWLGEGLSRDIYRMGLAAGGRVLGVPVLP